MDEKYVQKQKRRLEDLRGRLREEINRMIEAVQEEERPPGEHERRGVPSESVEKEIHLENREEAIRRAIHGALERIENGSYGKCERCGRQIPQARLDAIPYAERCLECEQTLERA
jgi:RNA polymerase-binding protein DksA